MRRVQRLPVRLEGAHLVEAEETADPLEIEVLELRVTAVSDTTKVMSSVGSINASEAICSIAVW